MLEAEIKRRMVKSAQKEGHYARRIEDAFSVGFPDTILIPVGGPAFFVEVKRVAGLRFAPSPRQLVELDRLAATNAVVPLVLGVDADTWTFWVSRPAKVILTANCPHDILPNGQGLVAFLKGATNE
jgi:hypothetical protein